MLNRMKKISIVTALVATVAFGIVGCGGSNTKSDGGKSTDTKPASTKEQMITAAGSTFVNPLFSKMFSEYNKLHPEIKVNYQSIGSGAGIKQLTEGTVDFAASDAFMKDDQIQAVKNGVIQVPVTVGAISIIYNVEGVESGLKLTQQTLTDIYTGKIKKWNDPALKADNSNVNLPEIDITPVYRTDGSGTTAIFTDYLSTVSSEWKDKVGKGTSVKFPVGVGGKGNEGVAGQVNQIPGSIGYTELAYATVNKISFAQLKNKDGNFVSPSLEAATLAAEAAAKDMPQDTRVSIVEKPGEKSYGIVGFTWALVNTKYDDQDKQKAIVDLIKWTYRDGQKYSNELTYAKIPDAIAKINDKNLESIK